MAINITTYYKSDADPDRAFPTYEEALEHERVVVPREVVSSILIHEGRCDYDDVGVIDKIVARLGELWNVQGYSKPSVG